MSKKKYANAAEKQRAWRLRHGQKRKVPLEIRRGQELGSGETTLREKQEGETWQEYHEYILKSIEGARGRERRASGKLIKGEKPGGDMRWVLVYPGDYYEMQREREARFQEGKIKEKEKKEEEKI